MEEQEKETDSATDRTISENRSGSGTSSRGSVASSPCSNVSDDEDNEINVVDDEDGVEAGAETIKMAVAAPMSICEQLESMVTRYGTISKIHAI